MKITKQEAKQEVETYSRLLQDYGFISEIEGTEVRQEIEYSFAIFDPYGLKHITCRGVKELAQMLCALWTVYLRVRFDLGLDAEPVDVV